MINASDFAECAISDRYTGIPYSKLDCQGFVERVMKDSGIRNSAGQPYNFRGSNDMWRNALAWKGTISECKKKYGNIPPGAWAFIVKNDGGEKERGYNDNLGNAAHVGIYCVPGLDKPVRDSTRYGTRDGVGYRSLSDFTHIGIPKMISFDHPAETDAITLIRQIKELLNILEETLKG